MTDEIKANLNELSELRSMRDLIMADKQAMIDGILTDEIKAQIAEIELEFASKIDSVSDSIASLEALIKRAVIEHGASVKGDRLHAVYTRGRVSWDTKALDGYAVAHPELTEFRREGEPSVSIRAV